MLLPAGVVLKKKSADSLMWFLDQTVLGEFSPAFMTDMWTTIGRTQVQGGNPCQTPRHS